MKHDLKIWPSYFAAVKNGEMTCQVRVCDRPYAVGDTLLLNEYLPEVGKFTGNRIEVQVTHITQPGDLGLAYNICVMSIVLQSKIDGRHMESNKACQGAATRSCRIGAESAQECIHCGVKVSDDLVEDVFFGFAASCEQ